MLDDLFQQVRARLSDDTPKKTEETYKCPRCRAVSALSEFLANQRVCPACAFHDRLPSHERIALLTDPNSFTELNGNLRSANPIDFPGYEKKQMLLRAETGLSDAIITGTATVEGIPFCLGVMDSRYMMGSMGSVVGERLTRLFEYATERGLPVVVCTASGGARMQEGAVSLMQMAKTSGAVKLHSNAGLLYITLLTDPTTGGVTASFASLGDIILAEPKVLVGFAGRRVIENTIRQRLPDDFQLAEHIVRHGFADAIVSRSEQREKIAELLRLHGYEEVGA
ncbi:MAG: acetyl-CoA carboxylase, carboxyltransferase subunit beta [Ruminococcus sp.]|nr:acetyl-CoA carboxylase, carboxyltransferase subunit beta [Ruminococcus sp.]